MAVSAINRVGLDATWKAIQEYRKVLNVDDRLKSLRKQQKLKWFHREIKNSLLQKFFNFKFQVGM